MGGKILSSVIKAPRREREESKAMIRRWKFYAESLDDEGGFYLGEDILFIGTDRESDHEAEDGPKHGKRKTPDGFQESFTNLRE